jgi:hypothetical protein
MMRTRSGLLVAGEGTSRRVDYRHMVPGWSARLGLYNCKPLKAPNPSSDGSRETRSRFRSCREANTLLTQIARVCELTRYRPREGLNRRMRPVTSSALLRVGGSHGGPSSVRISRRRVSDP